MSKCAWPGSVAGGLLVIGGCSRCTALLASDAVMCSCGTTVTCMHVDGLHSQVCWALLFSLQVYDSLLHAVGPRLTKAPMAGSAAGGSGRPLHERAPAHAGAQPLPRAVVSHGAPGPGQHAQLRRGATGGAARGQHEVSGWGVLYRVFGACRGPGSTLPSTWGASGASMHECSTTGTC